MKNKIILVGNGPSILKKENGKIIDSFDIVVRFNWFHIEKYEKYVGEKTNFWFTTVACPTRMKLEYDKIVEHSWEWDPDKDKNYEKLLNKNTNTIKIKRDTILEIQEFVNDKKYFTYSTGSIAIWELLKEYDNLVITGFDWWENHEKHHYGDNQRIGNIHKPDKEFVFIKKLID